MAKYIKVAFATSGDTSPVPDGTQPDGSVSFNEGWSPDYAKDQATDPEAKDIPRQSENYLKLIMTDGIKELQELGFKIYDNEVNYPVKARVVGVTGLTYIAEIANGPELLPIVDPVGDVTGTWIPWGFNEAQIQSFIDATPVPQATEVLRGGGEVATKAEQESAADNTKLGTPANQQWHPSAAKVWVNFDGTGVVSMRENYNVQQIIDHGAGYYELDFITDMATPDYVLFGSAAPASDNAVVPVVGLRGHAVPQTYQTVSSVRIIVNASNDVGTSGQDYPVITVGILGTLDV